MKIGIRLKAVADLVDVGSHIIDVGCDHAYLDIYLMEKRIKIKAIASDIKEGPLKQAKKNIEKHHLENVILLKQGNGIEPMEEDTNTVVISGMGGRNMIGIFKNQLEKLSQVTTLVLSPNNDVDLLRVFLSKHDFYLEQEIMVEENNIIYPILKWKRGTKHYSKPELLLGPVLLKEKTPLFLKYLAKEKQRKEITLRLLPRKYIWKRFKLKRQLKWMEEAIAK